jgi:KUP system potassium uptake protein
MENAASPSPRRQATGALTLAALGIVYGDIGTSPLYTVKEVFAPATGVPLDAPHLVGAVSTIVWALMLVVTLKYVLLILRADHHGEGGGLALAALAANAVAARPRLSRALLLLGVVGATLFYGDSIITPAISVLGAMEGLTLLAPGLQAWVLPATVAILLALFAVQRFGTAHVGRWFGPVIVLWFTVLGAVGVLHVLREPAILAALNPLHAWQFLSERGWHVFAAVGAIVLAITGAEALYADLGHFGRRPIRLAWTFVVFPGLALNYLGQGALLMADPKAIENPFYRLFPESWLVPALVLATLAAIIASQAVISGAYSVTQQAVQLGFLPRLAVRYTSARERGQIYMPAVNAALAVGVVGAVVAFGSSSALAAAYGVAVTLTMLVTTLLTYVVVRHAWRLPLPVALGATLFFALLDGALVVACAAKFLDGGWFPLALSALLFALMLTWDRGRARLLALQRDEGLPLEGFVQGLATPGTTPPHRATRTAVYPVADPTRVPQALLHNLKHNQVLHERNIVVTVQFERMPFVPAAERATVQDLGQGFWCVRVRYGFMEKPDLPAALAAVPALALSAFETSWFLSRATLSPAAGGGLRSLGMRLFAAMSRNAGSAAAFLRLPANTVVELGTRVVV